MKQILFVDDEQHVLEGLKRLLYPLRRQYGMVFVSSGQEALDLLRAGGFDVLVTDLRMPGMTGVDLLSAVIGSRLQVVRMVLSGTADHDLTLRSALMAHQYLKKPCDGRALRYRIERALSHRYLPDNESLRQSIAGLTALPIMKETLEQLAGVLCSSGASEIEVGRIVAGDPALAAKVLQLVNSCLFCTGCQITDPGAAVARLGVESIRTLALGLASSPESDGGACQRLSHETLRAHSIKVAAVARGIAMSMQLDEAAARCAFGAALLHDIGKVVLAVTRPADYDAAIEMTIERGISAEAAEREVFGATHAEAGAFLLWLWGLPDDLIDAVALHHQSLAQTPSPCTAVQVAEAVVDRRDNVRQDLTCLGPLAADLAHWTKLYPEPPEGGPHAQPDSLC